MTTNGCAALRREDLERWLQSTAFEAAHASEKWQENAGERAHAILMEHLTPSQRQDYTEWGHFEVRDRRGQRWRLYAAWPNLGRTVWFGREERYCVQFGREERYCVQFGREERYCVQPIHPLPVGDHLLTLLMWLKTDPARVEREMVRQY